MKKVLWSILLLSLTTSGILLRIFHVEADFPSGITWSGVLYTDEGWYSNGAIHKYLLNQWYLPGDFNPIVNMPVFHLIQFGMFRIFGLSIITARMTVVVFTLFSFLIVYQFVRKTSTRLTANLVLLLLSVNFFLFAYSRLAILEIPMTCLAMLSIVLANGFSNRYPTTMSVVSAAVLLLAIFVKPTAIFMLPPLLFVISTREGALSRRVRNCFFVLLVVGGGILGHYWIGMRWFRSDYMYFTSLNISSRISFHISTIVKNALQIIWQMRMMETTVVVTLFMLLPITLVVGKIKSRLLNIALVWMGSYIALLSLTAYHPPRFFLPLIIPVIIIFSVIITHYLHASSTRRLAQYGVVILCALIIMSNMIRNLGYIRSLQYSFVNMGKHIQERLKSYGTEHILIVGHFADSISLLTQIPGMNSHLGTGDLAWRLRAYQPLYYITLGEARSDTLESKTLQTYYDMDLVSSYDVFGNYYGGKKVYLYALKNKLQSQKASVRD